MIISSSSATAAKVVSESLQDKRAVFATCAIWFKLLPVLLITYMMPRRSAVTGGRATTSVRFVRMQSRKNSEELIPECFTFSLNVRHCSWLKHVWLAKRRGKLFSAPARRLSARIEIDGAHRKASRSVLDSSVFRIYGAFYIASRGLALVKKVTKCVGGTAQIEVTMMKAHDGEVIRIVFFARFPPSLPVIKPARHNTLPHASLLSSACAWLAMSTALSICLPRLSYRSRLHHQDRTRIESSSRRFPTPGARYRLSVASLPV